MFHSPTPGLPRYLSTAAPAFTRPAPAQVWELNKLRDITTYRDVAHASIFTGTMGVPDSEPWLQDGVEARGCGAGEKHAVGA
mmetsp:Transcript_29427/g.77351  ORF Transcript_29427/g.77351 Transcript_29427/m.77351 type:complete len:82 (-) Transcript_29427:324-569(-)